MRIAVFVGLMLGFLATTGWMLAEWFAPGHLFEDFAKHWPTVIQLHGVFGHMLAGFSAVLVGWRLDLRWLERTGWLGLLLSAAMLAGVLASGSENLFTGQNALGAIFNPGEDATTFDQLARFVLLMLPRLLFLLSLLVWVRRMSHHGLVFTASMSLCFVGLLFLFVFYLVQEWNIAELYQDTLQQTSLSHASLYVPLLLTVPAFLIPRLAPARLMPTAWTGFAALCFFAVAALVMFLGSQGQPAGRSDFPSDLAGSARQVSILGALTLIAWVGALWAHRK